MDQVKRKVLLDIFAAPSTLIPLAGGLTALLASWAVQGNAWLTFAGIAGVLGGLGLLASRLVLGLEGLTQRAYEHVLAEQRKAQEEAFESLHERLLHDQDPRTQVCLRDLRTLYARLKKSVEDGTVSSGQFGVVEGVDKLFQSCVRQLTHSVELWETAQSLTGSARRAALAQREQLVTEVAAAVEQLSDTVQRFQLQRASKSRSELSALRKELDESMRVAQEVERRTAELTRETQDSVVESELVDGPGTARGDQIR